MSSQTSTTDNPFKKKQAEKIEARNRCQFCPQVHRLPKKQVKLFYEAMLDSSIAATTIQEVVNSWGIDVTQTTIVNHRGTSRKPTIHPKCMAAYQAMFPSVVTG